MFFIQDDQEGSNKLMNQSEQRPALKEEPIQQDTLKERNENPTLPQTLSLETLSLMTYLQS